MNQRSWSRCILVSTLSLLMVNLGVGPLAADTAHSRAVARPTAGSTADGESLFRGVFFASGPDADVLAEVWNTPEAAQHLAALHSPESVAIQNRIVSRLAQDDAHYFERFSTEMRSGDQIRVEGTLREAGTRLKTLATESARHNNGRLNSSLTGNCVDFELAIVAAVAVAVVAGVVIYIEFWVNNRNTTDGLQHDVLVDHMTQRLAVR
jgi:SdpC family antimicrobial peptide